MISIKEKTNSNLSNILATFQPITWWLLLLSLVFISMVNIKPKINFLIDYVNSLIDNIECLLTKQSKCYLKNENLRKIQLFYLKSEFNRNKSNEQNFIFAMDSRFILLGHII